MWRMDSNNFSGTVSPALFSYQTNSSAAFWTTLIAVGLYLLPQLQSVSTFYNDTTAFAVLNIGDNWVSGTLPYENKLWVSAGHVLGIDSAGQLVQAIDSVRCRWSVNLL